MPTHKLTNNIVLKIPNIDVLIILVFIKQYFQKIIQILVKTNIYNKEQISELKEQYELKKQDPRYKETLIAFYIPKFVYTEFKKIYKIKN